MTKPRKVFPPRTSYWQCPGCGYAVTISNRWARAGVPRCLNEEVQPSGALCPNRARPLERRESRPRKAEIVAPEDQPEQANNPAAPTGDPSIYGKNRYQILRKLLGHSHEEAMAIMKAEMEDA